MDRADIKMYKDGNDIIIVFKNASSGIEDFLKNMFSDRTEPSFKEVPDLEELPCPDEPMPDLAKFMEAPEETIKRGFDGFVEILTAIHNEEYKEDMLERAKKECCQYFDSHNRIKVDQIDSFEYERIKTFIQCFYKLNFDLVNLLESGKYASIDSLISEIDEKTARIIAEEISKKVIELCTSASA